MGLDCYVYARAKDAVDDEQDNQIWYGRKTNEIHGWMEQAWLELNPERDGAEFNCEDLTLTPELLDELEDAATNKTLAVTTGFFFGVANGDDAVADDVQELVTAARQALADGLHVFYHSWW